MNSPAPLPSDISTHYENFPVASVLCPPQLRPAVKAIYGFARSADDLADEGDISAAQRLEALACFRRDLHATAAGEPGSGCWPQVFQPLALALQGFALPLPLLEALLDAFEQDVVKTRDAAGYASHAELLDYCSRSANPIGRLMLHLYGVSDATALRQSDAICSALQLINFWQDLSRDIPRRRYYVPQHDLTAFGVDAEQLLALQDSAQSQALIQCQCHRARALMLEGAGLVHALPGRIGWELRLVVQGGLRILDKIQNAKYAVLQQRPHLTLWDLPVLLWRAVRM